MDRLLEKSGCDIFQAVPEVLRERTVPRLAGEHVPRILTNGKDTLLDEQPECQQPHGNNFETSTLYVDTVPNSVMEPVTSLGARFMFQSGTDFSACSATAKLQAKLEQSPVPRTGIPFEGESPGASASGVPKTCRRTFHSENFGSEPTSPTDPLFQHKRASQNKCEFHGSCVPETCNLWAWVICARRHLVLDRLVNPRQLYHLSPAKFAVVLQRCIGEFNCTDAYDGKSPVCSSVTGDQHRACQLHRLIALGGFKGRNAGRPSQGWEVDCSEASGRRDAKFMSDMADDDRRQFRGLGPSRRVPG